MNNKITCKICGIEYKNYVSISTHIIRKHKISTKEYYDKYFKKNGEGLCSVCKNETDFINMSKGYREFCSHKCSSLDHSPFKNKEIREKSKQTCLKNHGVKYPLQSKEIKKKFKQTNLDRYGGTGFQSKELSEKIKLTCLKKYGVENVFQNEETQNKFKHTCLEKYGHKSPLENKEIREKGKQTNLKKFIPLLNKQLEYLDLELLDKNYINNTHKHNWKCLKCNIIFETKYSYLQQGYGNCPKCFPRNKGYSKGEKELVEFVKSLELEFVENDRNKIKPYELDIYIPSKRIAIEFDGLYWHSEKNIKDKNYHLNKTDLCQSKKIQLIHIFEDEWVFKQEIVKARLKQILNLNNSERIHARKCIIKEIDPKTKNEFLEKFHIQGEDKSNIKLGAFYNDELISVMTFSHGNISKGSKNIENIWELNRFCSNSNYHIPGIASKLLTHFKRNYEWKEIFSYADRRWSDGNVYRRIGFKLDSITKPNYWYLDNFNRIHRFSLRKCPDEPKDIPEWVLRFKEGYTRIWDCGHYKFKI